MLLDPAAPGFASVWCQGKEANEEVDFKTWITIYANYLDKGKRIDEGRKIPLEKCCEQPMCPEIAEVCRYLGFNHAIEHYKRYPRDWSTGGRVRVQIKNEDGTPVKEEYATRKSIMIKCGELIPQLASRAARAKQIEQVQQAQKAAAGGGAGGGGGSSSKKKGKKKR